MLTGIFFQRQRSDYRDVLADLVSTTAVSQEPTGEQVPEALETTDTSTSQDLRLVYRIIHHLLNHDDDEALARAYAQGTAASFAYLATQLNINHQDINISSRTAKRALFGKLTDFVSPQ